VKSLIIFVAVAIIIYVTVYAAAYFKWKKKQLKELDQAEFEEKRKMDKKCISKSVILEMQNIAIVQIRKAMDQEQEQYSKDMYTLHENNATATDIRTLVDLHEQKLNYYNVKLETIAKLMKAYIDNEED